MSRRFTTLAVSAAIAGGVLFSAVPAQAAPAADRGSVSARGPITCNIPKMRQQVANLKSKAGKLDALGYHKSAAKERAKARAIQARIEQCEDADNNAPGPIGG
ncbi:hypothetical protein ACFYWS_18360 [Streptomyces sp. NPDC002795]|uniref:hypothetical protein n=1 Tax=Streptomyces sp. NPDC002795 TaxID=3364665 RepID=UPI0036828BA3